MRWAEQATTKIRSAAEVCERCRAASHSQHIESCRVSAEGCELPGHAHPGAQGCGHFCFCPMITREAPVMSEISEKGSC